MGNWKEELKKTGLVDEAHVHQEGQGGEPTIPASTSQGVDFSEFPDWALRWAHAGVQLIGREQLVKALEAAATDGTNRAAGAFENRVERALDRLTVTRANELRADLFSLYRGKGYPTFCGNANTVSEVITSGAYDAWLDHERDEASEAETLVIPQSIEGENIDLYRQRLDDWSADKPGALLKRIGFDQLVRREQERREQAKMQAADELKSQAVRELTAGLAGSFQSAIEFLKEWSKNMKLLYEQGLVSSSTREELAQAAIMRSPWPWSLYLEWKKLPYEVTTGVSIYYAPTNPPTASDGGNISDDSLIRQLTGHSGSRSPLVAEAVRRWPVASDEVRLVSKGDSSLVAVYPDGKVEEVSPYHAPAGLAREQALPGPGTYSAKPTPEGWWNRLERGGVWCPPDVYYALNRLEAADKGSVFITPDVVSDYGRHPERGYPRFYYKVSAGRRWSSFDLPVWRPREGEGWIVQRLDDILLLSQYGVVVPEAAYWMDVQLGQTAKGNPRLEPVRLDQEVVSAILTKRGEGAKSQGRWGWSAETHSACKGTEKSGSRIVWSTFVSSAGGGVHRTFDLLWITQSGSIGLDNGVAVTFDGEKIVNVAGGALLPEADPTRGQ